MMQTDGCYVFWAIDLQSDGTVTEEKTLYREWTPWPGWAATIYWLALMAVVVPFLAGFDTDLPSITRGLLALGVVALGAGLARVIGGLTVLVQETRLYLFLGSYPVIRRAVPYSEILDLHGTEYRPLAEFGGWGVRGFGKKKAWTARGNEAVVMTLTGDRLLYVGSDHPQRLEERIRTVAGEGLGASAEAPSAS